MYLQPIRLNAARVLITANVIWPFVNTAYFFPESTLEVNLLPLFLAICLAPEVLFEDWISLALTLAALALAALWGPAESALRLTIGIVPCLFIISLYRRLLRCGKELIPYSVAYGALLAFVGFSVLQHIDFNLFPIFPGWLQNALTAIVPRYMDAPYDEFGSRGVQGWASEPSGAALTCFSFCVIAMQQNPAKRWRILLLFAILAAVNKSVYAMLLLAFLGLICLWQMRRKMYFLLALVPSLAAFSYFALQSIRLMEVKEGLLLFGLSQDTNRDLARLAQIIYPLGSFPAIYRPVNIYGIDMQPLGLIPVLIGYGSVIGVVLCWRLLFQRLRPAQAQWLPLGLVTIFALSFLSPPDFVPAVVAFVYGMAPRRLAVPVAAAPRRIHAPLPIPETC